MIKKLIICGCALVVLALLGVFGIKIKEMQKIDYVIDNDGMVAVYAYNERNPDYDLNEDTSKEISSVFENYFKGKYCFAFWAPHGAFWQDECFDKKSECESALAERKEIGSSVNTKKCYKPYTTTAWCINSIKTGINRYYDDNTYGEMLTEVCVANKKQCEKLEKYKHLPSTAICHKQTVFAHPSFYSYIWTQKDVDKLIYENEHNKPLVHLK